MKKEIKVTLQVFMEFVQNYDITKKKQLVKIINTDLDRLIKILEKFLKKKPIKKKRDILVDEVNKDLGVGFGVSRTIEEIIFANWILELQPRTRSYLLTYTLIKESILHFYDFVSTEVDEVIINILTIILLKELFEIKTHDNPMFSAIRSKIYSEEIAELNHLFWDNLLLLLLKKDISFIDILTIIEEFTRKKLKSEDKVRLFSEWVLSNTVREEDVIAPIFTNQKSINMIETLLDIGYEESDTSFISKKLNLTQSTVAIRLKSLNKSYSTFWLSSINYEKLNLHNYFIKIVLDKNKPIEDLAQSLLEIPYLKTLYHGTNSQSSILYSPSFICPHIVSENLHERLRNMHNHGSIKDFSVQLVREKYRYFALSNYPYNPTIKTFQRLIRGGDPALKKYVFSQERRSSRSPVKEKSISLDYNLLYFLSIITGKYLLKIRYLARLKEFQKFYTENDISLTDVEAQTALMYQFEQRAKSNNLLSFSLFMRNLVKRGNDVLIFELPITNEGNQKDIRKIIDKLRIFSYMGQITLYDRYVFQIPGVTHTHPIREIIQEVLKENELSSQFYTIKLQKSKYVPLQELFNFEEQKWKITDFK